jgi:ABC-type multidrug transport system fused ATPase/permease subunit
LPDPPFSWGEVPRSIWYFIAEDKRRFVVLNSILFFIFFYELVPPYIAGKVVDFFTTYEKGQPLSLFIFYCVFLGASYAIVSLLRVTTKNAISKVGISAKVRARVWGFERLMDMALQWRTNEASGNRVQRLFNGSQSLADWIKLTRNRLLLILVSFIGVLGVFLFLSPWFVVFMLAYLVLFFTIEVVFSRKVEALSNAFNRSREVSSGAYIEGAANVFSIKALGVQDNMEARVQGNEEESKRMEFAIANTGMRKWYFFQTLNGVSYASFLLMTGWEVLEGRITVGFILTFFSYFLKLRDAAIEMSELTTEVVQLKSDLARMMPIFKKRLIIPTGNEPFPKQWDSIELRDASFTYPESRAGLKSVSLLIRRGEKLGISGESGSGKSTFVKLLLGLYAAKAGRFTIGGKNYYDISHDEVVKHTAVVLQETELFNLPLRDNITVMRDIDPKFLDLAVDIARLRDVIDRLPEGLDTVIGDKGHSLSGGERQRVGIARAVCKNAPIMVLDEATSALDAKTEEEVIGKLFGEFGKDKTFVVIAHRQSTLKHVDRVVKFESGKLIEGRIAPRA